MIPCVDCGYQSKSGNKHWGNCRLILLEWIRQGGPEKEGFPMDPLRDDELVELEGMIVEMEKRGAKRDTDGYFGDCFILEER